MKDNPGKVLSDRSRRVKTRSEFAVVPLKFDEDGNPANDATRIVKTLSVTDLRFLKIWRDDAKWDVAKALELSGLPAQKCEKLIKKLACFREEEARVQALCAIPTPEWIAAKHVENVYTGELTDTHLKSLQELAKIEGAYKQQAASTQINVFNLPELPPDQAQKIKEVFDTIALQSHDAA